MTENIENIENSIKIESKGQRDLILQELRIRKENQQLKKDNQLLSDELTYFKERCADLEDKINDLQTENTHFKAKNLAMSKRLNYLTSAEAGRDFARSLLGKPMTEADLAEEKFIAEGEAHYERTAFIGDDF